MNEEQWMIKYISYLRKHGGLSFQQARDAYKAGEEGFDMENDDPEDCAQEELSYYRD